MRMTTNQKVNKMTKELLYIIYTQPLETYEAYINQYLRMSFTIGDNNKENRKRSRSLQKRIVQLNKHGIIIESFDSLKQASDHHGILKGSIANVCNGHRHTIRGLMFKYI